MKKQVYFFLCFCSFVIHTKAQTILDTVVVEEVKIMASKFNTFSIGYKIETFDTILTKNLQNQSLSDLLAMHNGIYLKNYGPGNLASPSLRGTGANHTAVVWNGINLQNNMNGSIDFSLVPLSATDEINIQYGASSTLYGSGAIGGAINLNNKAKFNKGNQCKIASGYGSFQSIPLYVAYHYSNAKTSLNIKPYVSYSKNNFQYYDNTHQLNNRQHNEYFKNGLSAEIYHKLSESQLISIKYWQQNSDRQIAPALTQFSNTASQQDQSYRTVLEWQKHHIRYNIHFKSAYLYDFLQYKDSASHLNSINNTHSFINELESSIQLNEKQQIILGLNNTFNTATSFNLQQNPSMNKLAFFAAYKISFKHVVTNISFRKEFIPQYNPPVVPSIGTEIKILPSLSFKGNAATCYRIPTFNDLYWQNAGNPRLKPEYGYQVEGGLVWQKTISSKWQLHTEANVYLAHIDNWIIWLPNGIFWSPQNLMKVYSRGTETVVKLQYKHQQICSSLSIHTNYRLSTNEKTKLPNDASLGKQLIYVPIYSFSASYMLQYKKAGLIFNQTYNGYRYTASDHSSYLKPYLISNLQLFVNHTFAKHIVNISLLANNFLNTNYQTIVSYPMPLANYQLNVSFTI